MSQQYTNELERVLAVNGELLEALKDVRGLIAYLGEGEPNDEYDEMLGPKLPALLKKVDAAIAKVESP